MPHVRASRFAVLMLVLALTVASLAAGCSSAAPKAKTTTPTTSSDATATDAEASLVDTPPVTAQAPTGGQIPMVVTEFAKQFSGRVWYPTKLPAGAMMEEPQITTLEPSTEIVCDVYLTFGDAQAGLTQGSAELGNYEIQSLGKVPWGTEKADIVYEDPSDTTSAKMIVFKAKDTVAELYGGTGIDQLKQIAASMVIVKK